MPLGAVGIISGISSPSLERVVTSSRETRPGHTSSDKLRVELAKAKRLLAEKDEELERVREEERQRALVELMRDVVKEEVAPLIARLNALEGISPTSGDAPALIDSQRMRLVQIPEERRYGMTPRQQGVAAATTGGGGLVGLIWLVVEMLTR
jgi:hypothetical protein